MNKDKLKILIVDDSMEWIRFHINLLNQLFEKADLEVNFEVSAKKGFNNFIKNTEDYYDVIISDLEMEEIYGESYAGSWFVRNILKREESKNSKIIIISGSPDIHTIAKQFNVDFIPKHLLFNNPLLMSYKLKEILT